MDIKIFAKRLAQLREQKGASARDMSLTIGQNAGYINAIENEKALPSMDGFFYICEFLGLSESEFFDLESTNPTKLNEIVQEMKKLNSHQLELLEALVKEIARK